MSHDLRDEHGNGDGVQRQHCTVLNLVFNHDTCLVSIGLRDVAIGLAQMILDEAVRQLDIMRRQAAQVELMAQCQDAEKTREILASLRGKR